MKRVGLLLSAFVLIAALAYIGYRWLLPRFSNGQSNSNDNIGQWFDDPAARPSLTTAMNRTICPGAPFILPSDGLIGLLWNDPAGPYTVFNPHTGIDVFGDGEAGEVPVYAAFDGLLTRHSDWIASVIIKHDDPLQEGRAIWTYYTHMASRDGAHSFIVPAFAAGVEDIPVKQGDLLGYQGEFAGVGRPPIGLHVHFSIVTSDDEGNFKNEAVIGNTLDPSPYLGMPLNIAGWPQRPIHCQTP
ncbi:MAG: M23 family metallopeptidase [Anaerolineae bacterium]